MEIANHGEAGPGMSPSICVLDFISIDQLGLPYQVIRGLMKKKFVCLFLKLTLNVC